MNTPNTQNFDGLSYTAIPRIVNALPYEVLHILDSFPESVLAGGAIASILTGQPVKDYDIFISGTSRLADVKKRLNDYKPGHVYADYTKPIPKLGEWHTSPRAETWIPEPGVWYGSAHVKVPAAPIQIIHAYTFSTPKELLAQFDYTIAQAAFFWNPVSSRFGGSWQALAVGGYLEDLLARQLVYNPLSLPSPEPPKGGVSPQQNQADPRQLPLPLPSPLAQADGDPGGNFIQEDALTMPTLRGSAIAGAFYRLVKYTSRGYHITPDSLAALMHNWTEYVDWARKTGLEAPPETADSILDLFAKRTSPPINIGAENDLTQ